MDGVFEAANPTKCLIFMHTTRGIQHTLLVGSALRNITSAGREGILPTAAGILSWWKKPSSPGGSKSHQELVASEKSALPNPPHCVITAGLCLTGTRVGCLCLTESGQGLPHLWQVTRTLWASTARACAFQPLRAALPALGRCYLCESLSRKLTGSQNHKTDWRSPSSKPPAGDSSQL